MKYLVLEQIDDKYYLVGSKPFDMEAHAVKMVDLCRETNPNKKYQVIELLESNNLEVVKNDWRWTNRKCDRRTERIC